MQLDKKKKLIIEPYLKGVYHINDYSVIIIEKLQAANHDIH